MGYKFKWNLCVKPPRWPSPRELEPPENIKTTDVLKDGLIKITKKLILEPDGRPIPSVGHLMLKELYWRKLVLKPNSLTLLSENASEFNLLRTERRSLLLYPRMVA